MTNRAPVSDLLATSRVPNLDRRTVLSGFAAALLAIRAEAFPSPTSASDTWDKTLPDDDEDTRSDSPDDAGLEGIARMEAWMVGDIPGVAVPDPSWTFVVSNASNFGFYAPPDWRYSETLQQTPREFDYGYVTRGGAISPDGEATFLIIDFQLLMDTMTMDEFIDTTLGELAGEEQIELVSERSLSFLAEDDARFTGVRFADLAATMQTFGSTYRDPSTRVESSSYSTTIQIGPADRFDELATDYFLPMISNFQRFSGGSEATPTPTPEP